MNTNTVNLSGEETGMQINWLNYPLHKEQIRELRKRVFVDEQQFGEFVVDSPFDEHGLHLGLFDGSLLVSCISIFLFPKDHSFLQKLQIATHRSHVIQFSRRAELQEYRSQKFATLMAAYALKTTYELFQPDTIFALLQGKHTGLEDTYVRIYGFNRVFGIEDPHGSTRVLVLDNRASLQNLYLKLRNECIRLSHVYHLELPDLAHHIMNSPELTNYFSMEADSTNRYLQPLALEDELPRLSAQARMLFLTQHDFWKKILKEKTRVKRIMDLGCGPGVYLAHLRKLAEVKEIELTGMDISDQLIAYAKIAHPRIHWLTGSAYQTGLSAESFDLIHTSFLFIHLLKPFLALTEIQRILAPNGLLYITDVNDGTFEGPEVIRKMVEAHSDIYEGNRKIMYDLPFLAENAGFDLIDSLDITVTNEGSDDAPIMENGTLKLGKWTLWAMFSFMGQRAEVIQEFELAEKHYLSHQDTISIQIQTKLFKKR
jgi:SAM-dependent methyltransferase